MPSFADVTTPGERWDLVNYVLSLARRPPWESGGRLDGPGQHADLRTRGEYLVHAEMCGLCHTMINRTGIYRGDDAYLAGGMRVEAYPHGVFVTRNLTSDPETGLGRWTEAGIATALRTGRAPDRVLNLWGMPWMYLHQLTDDDARAVARYLKTLSPVRNDIPPALRFGMVETIAAKLTRPLPAANPTVLTYADGNFGSTKGPVWRHRPQQALIIAQGIVRTAEYMGPMADRGGAFRGGPMSANCNEADRRLRAWRLRAGGHRWFARRVLAGELEPGACTGMVGDFSLPAMGDRVGVGRLPLVLGFHGRLRRPRCGRSGSGPPPSHQHQQPAHDHDL
jgi:mono/diheme cytochrome c family protein